MTGHSANRPERNKMEYTSETDENRKIITVRITGEIHMEKAASMGQEVRTRAKRDHYRLLFDLRKAKNNITIIQAYNWITEFYDSVDPHLKWVPTAHLINTDDEEFFSFVETIFINRGANIRLFKDEGKAVEWLEYQKPESAR